jgi:thiol-disulfide isomerase/thioredoxin
MSPVLVASVLVLVVALSTGLGLVWRASTGRIRGARGDETVIRVSELADAAPGSGATLLQFSTEVCAPCRTTHGVLGRLAEQFDGVAHVDVDVTHRPDLANRFNLLQSPTTFVLDARGVVRARIGGAPRVGDLRAELDRILAA